MSGSSHIGRVVPRFLLLRALVVAQTLLATCPALRESRYPVQVEEEHDVPSGLPHGGLDLLAGAAPQPRPGGPSYPRATRLPAADACSSGSHP